MRLSALLLCAGLLHAQTGQEGSRPGWPCVAGRAVDPAYIETSESTGGQLFLFQKNEIGQAGPVMSASFTHPATVFRAIGTLAGSRDFDIPVESSVESILVLASMQCRSAIRVSRPSGTEMTAANSVQSVELQTGRILRVDAPEPGKWRVTLSGTGLFVLSVLAKSDLRLGVALQKGTVDAHLGGAPANVRFQLIDASGTPVADLEPGEPVREGAWRFSIAPPVERFRVQVTGTDANAWPFQRVYPNLFTARRP